MQKKKWIFQKKDYEKDRNEQRKRKEEEQDELVEKKLRTIRREH